MTDEILLPTRKDLARLPRWAKVAYAVRCAKRVHPLFFSAWPRAPMRHVEAVDKAIQAAEIMASQGRHDRSLDVVSISRAAAHAADAARAADADAAARAARAAAQTAALAADTSDPAQAAAAVGSVASLAASDAAHTVRTADADAARATAVAAARKDYARLLSLAEQKIWKDESPVIPAALGPLWPDGEPEWWPKDKKPSPPFTTNWSSSWSVAAGRNENDVSLSVGFPVPVPNERVGQIASAINRYLSCVEEKFKELGGGSLEYKLTQWATLVDATMPAPPAEPGGISQLDMPSAEAERERLLRHVVRMDDPSTWVRLFIRIVPATGASPESLNLLEYASIQCDDDLRDMVDRLSLPNRQDPATSASPIDFYFDLSAYTPAMIGEALSAISAMYTEMSGDELIIDDMGVFDCSFILQPLGGGGDNDDSSGDNGGWR